jgi:hypothetical protein
VFISKNKREKKMNSNKTNMNTERKWRETCKKNDLKISLMMMKNKEGAQRMELEEEEKTYHHHHLPSHLAEN